MTEPESVSIDVDLPTHPKMLGASDRAFRVWVEALCYARKYRTDGAIPASWLSARGVTDDVISELVTRGAWDQNGTGPVIHGYLDRYPPAADEDAAGIARSNAASNAARMRWDMRKAMQSVPEGIMRHIEVKPLGVGVGSKGKEAAIKAAFDLFYDHVYPRKASRPVAFRAFVKALATTPLDAILEGAQRYAEDPNRDQSYTKLPATWLNQECWNDPPLPPRGGSRGGPDRAKRAIEAAARKKR
jgi:hypothetical protein